MNVFTYGVEVQTNMAGKRRCQKMLAPTNIDNYNATWHVLRVLLPSVWLSARGSSCTVDSHDDGVRYVSKLANLR